MQKKENLISKVKMISKAFSSAAPDTDWYRKRMEICASCEFNTSNKVDPTALDRLQNKLKPACSVCHCFIDEKCKVEEATCGLEEAGLEPKWFPVSVPSKNKSGKDIRVYIEDGEVKLDYTLSGEVICNINSKLIIEKFSLKFTGADVKSVIPTCSCTTVGVDEKDDGYVFNFVVSTSGFRPGLNKREVLVEYYKNENTTVKMAIRLNINKHE